MHIRMFLYLCVCICTFVCVCVCAIALYTSVRRNKVQEWWFSFFFFSFFFGYTTVIIIVVVSLCSRTRIELLYIIKLLFEQRKGTFSLIHDSVIVPSGWHQLNKDSDTCQGSSPSCTSSIDDLALADTALHKPCYLNFHLPRWAWANEQQWLAENRASLDLYNRMVTVMYKLSIKSRYQDESTVDTRLRECVRIHFELLAGYGIQGGFKQRWVEIEFYSLVKLRSEALRKISKPSKLSKTWKLLSFMGFAVSNVPSLVLRAANFEELLGRLFLRKILYECRFAQFFVTPISQ